MFIFSKTPSTAWRKLQWLVGRPFMLPPTIPLFINGGLLHNSINDANRSFKLLSFLFPLLKYYVYLFPPLKYYVYLFHFI